MCRYGFKTYKLHFACFDCRKSFKRPPNEDLAIQNGDWEDYKLLFWDSSSKKATKFKDENPERVKELTKKYKNRKEKCPQCGTLMADLGMDFKPPKKDKVEEWKVVKRLLRVGKSFYSCGCDGIGYIPKNKKDYESYLLKNRAYYQERLDNRDAILNKEELSNYIQRFGQLVKMIDQELKVL